MKHDNVLWKAVLSQLASSSLTCLIHRLLRLISSPLTQTHCPCLLIFCDAGNYSPSNSYKISAALGCSNGCLVKMLIYPSPKHKLFKTENIPVRSLMRNIQTLQVKRMIEKKNTKLCCSLCLFHQKRLQLSHFIQTQICSFPKYPPWSDHQSTYHLSFAHQTFLWFSTRNSQARC